MRFQERAGLLVNDRSGVRAGDEDDIKGAGLSRRVVDGLGHTDVRACCGWDTVAGLGGRDVVNGGGNAHGYEGRGKLARGEVGWVEHGNDVCCA